MHRDVSRNFELAVLGGLLFVEYSPERRETISAIFGTIDVWWLSVAARRCTRSCPPIGPHDEDRAAKSGPAMLESPASLSSPS
jgi:hypothetical protein